MRRLRCERATVWVMLLEGATPPLDGSGRRTYLRERSCEKAGLFSPRVSDELLPFTWRGGGSSEEENVHPPRLCMGGIGEWGRNGGDVYKRKGIMYGSGVWGVLCKEVVCGRGGGFERKKE